MKVYTASATHSDTEVLLQRAVDQLSTQIDKTPSILIVYFNIVHDSEKIRICLSRKFSCPTVFASSCQGAFCLSPSGSLPTADIVLFAIDDPLGHYGVGVGNLDQTTAEQGAKKAINDALFRSELCYEIPTLVWCVMPPGKEEILIKGIASVIGDKVPVFGGSAADNDVSGEWLQGNNELIDRNIVVILVMQPSTPIGASYSSGYLATDKKFIAHGCENRTLLTLNHNNAAKEYNEATNGVISHAISGGNILSDTTLFPLGRLIPSPVGIEEYLLSHPESVTEQGGLSLFSDVADGQELILMKGSVEGLINRAAVVVKNAIDLLPADKTPAGILMIYCAGCMLAVSEHLASMQSLIAETAPEIPVCAAYTFGEQGCFLDGQNRHGNLMISAVVFSR